MSKKLRTIEDLKERWWFRFLVVANIFVFVLVLVITLWAVIGDNKKVRILDEKNTVVTCLHGNKKTYNLTEQQTYFAVYDFDESGRRKRGLPQYQRDSLHRACEITASEEAQFPGQDLFTVQPAFDYRGGLSEQFPKSLLALVIIFVVQWLIRGTFYYVAIGKFNPNSKTAHELANKAKEVFGDDE